MSWHLAHEIGNAVTPEELIRKADELMYSVKRAGKNAVHSICLPQLDPFVMPLIATIPVQLLAYHTAVIKGTDVDQPRNLAKSVTVE